jgi:hypothetical protein
MFSNVVGFIKVGDTCINLTPERPLKKRPVIVHIQIKAFVQYFKALTEQLITLINLVGMHAPS